MRKLSSLFTLAFVFSISAFVLPKSVFAQDADPPGRVARLNYIQGSVSYQMPDDQTWIDADPNRPLTTGNSLWVDRSSRGEVHIGSTAIRLASETGVSFLTLDDRTTQLELAQGTMEIHLRHLSPDDAFEVDTPNLSFTLSAAGEYRIQTDPDGNSTMIVVREGAGEVTGSGDSWDLRSGRQYVFNGADQLSYDAMPAPPYDDFEDWCQSRDQRENKAVSAQYVSRDVDGYYDLDDYGDWVSEPDYGMVWVPRAVVAGWSPYHVGHWVYIAPWGWTWVDAEPWGFAPFHYGRWVMMSDRWGWVPGPVVVRPVYSPALVAFVGGGGFSLSVSFGGGPSGVAWFPLGPRDVYVPSYRCSPRYFQTINVTNSRVVNVTQVTNVYNTVVINRNTTNVNYMYGRNARAVTAVSRDTFVNARPVGNGAFRINDDQIQHVRVVENAPIAPVRTSYVSSSAKISTQRPPVPFQQRPVVVRMNPATPVRERNANTPANQNNRQADRPGQFGNNNQPGARVSPNNSPVNSPNNVPNNVPQNNSRNGNVVPPPAPNNPPNGRINNGNNAQPNNNPQQQQQSRDGFHPFQPSAGNNNPPSDAARNNNTNNPSGNTGNRNQNNRAAPQTQQNNDRPAMRYTPPVRAKDDMYDVHPPLDHPNTPPQTVQAPPKQEQKPQERQQGAQPNQQPDRQPNQQRRDDRPQNQRPDQKNDNRDNSNRDH